MFWPCRVTGPNGEPCALEAGHDGEHIPAAVAPQAGASPSPPPGVTGAPWGASPAPAGRGPRVLIALVVAALALGGVAAFVIIGSGPAAPVTTPGASGPAAVAPPASMSASPPIGIVPSPSPTSSVRPLGLPATSGTPARTSAPLATMAPAPASATPASAPPATTGPTPKPLSFGALSYSSAACFAVNWKDAKGRQISGAEARYAITIKNPTGARTRTIWIGIQTTDQFATDPLLSRASWGKRPRAYGNETTLIIAGPRLDTGPTRLKWRAFYQTPIDVHARIWIAQGPSPAKGTMTLEEIQAGSALVWDVATDVRVCS